MKEVLGETLSLCPTCLGQIPARRVVDGENVYLEKSCPQHGHFKTLIWRGAESYLEWGKFGQDIGNPTKRLTLTQKGCPYDCGLCPEHRAETCFAVIEVAHRCNLKCPVCFASAGKKALPQPQVDTIREMYQAVLDYAGEGCPVQLSGGEPTIREDLPDIIALGKAMGISYFQVNTNGLRIAQDKDYLFRLKESGADLIYLQFDGLSDEVYGHIRGRNLQEIKLQAIENCEHAEIGVMLVATLIPGVNLHQVGDIIRFAKAHVPIVKGVHFQPISYFGRYPAPPRDQDRVTIPDVLQALEQQTDGELRIENFVPRRLKESYCSFGGFFVLEDDGKVTPVTHITQPQNSGCCSAQPKELPYIQTRSFVTQKWRFVPPQEGRGKAKPGSWESFFQRASTHTLSISCMPFQDVWNIDLERLKRCCIHVVTPEKIMVPLCAFYLTDAQGKRLYYQRAEVQGIVS